MNVLRVLVVVLLGQLVSVPILMVAGYVAVRLAMDHLLHAQILMNVKQGHIYAVKLLHQHKLQLVVIMLLVVTHALALLDILSLMELYVWITMNAVMGLTIVRLRLESALIRKVDFHVLVLRDTLEMV